MLSQARQQFVDLALSVVGLGAVPATRSAYLDLICTSAADRASPVTCAGLAAASGCALVVRGLWLRAGVSHPRLTSPYRSGMAVADVVEIARYAGALHGPGREIKPGDVVIIGGPEHVLTVVEVDGHVVRGVDGGQRDPQWLETIAQRERVYVPGPGATLGGRRVEYVIDCEAIAACESWVPATMV